MTAYVEACQLDIGRLEAFIIASVQRKHYDSRNYGDWTIISVLGGDSSCRPNETSVDNGNVDDIDQTSSLVCSVRAVNDYDS